MTQNEFKTVVITAEEGKYLTQNFDVELLDRTVADTVALGKFDKVENWKEISERHRMLLVRNRIKKLISQLNN